MIRKYVILQYISIFILLMGVHKVLADDGGVTGELGEGLGSVAIFLLAIGSSFAIVRRSVYWYTRWDGADKEIKKEMKRFYARIKIPLLHIHQVSLILATIIAIIHGVLLAGQEGMITIYSGWIAAGSMVFSTVSGFFLWRKIKPLVKSSVLFLPIRLLHRQWVLTLIFAVFLIIHVA